MKKYRISKYSLTIDVVDVARETESFVILPRHNGGERRDAKHSKYTDYYDTWEEARNELLCRRTRRIDDLNKDIERLNTEISKISAVQA